MSQANPVKFFMARPSTIPNYATEAHEILKDFYVFTTHINKLYCIFQFKASRYLYLGLGPRILESQGVHLLVHCLENQHQDP